MDRNEKLDILKGIACILMLLAHNTVVNSSLDRKLQFFGGMAPVFFFAVSGIILVNHQLKRKPPGELLAYYLIFFFVGFSYNDVWTVKDNSAFWSSNILQEVALSSVIIVLLSLRFDVQKLAWLFPLPFVIHLAAPYLPSFPLKQFFFRPPGLFPLFPWLGFFLLGILCQRLESLHINAGFRWSLAILLPVGMVLGPQYGIKWNMNTAYFAVSSMIFAASYFLLREAKVFPFKKRLVFLGKNSLLFLFVHLFARDIIDRYTANNPALWLGSLALSLLMMKILIRLNTMVPVPDKLWPGIWSGLVILIAAVPYLSHGTAYVLTYAVGFYMALNYGKLTILVKTLAGSKRTETYRGDIKVSN